MLLPVLIHLVFSYILEWYVGRAVRSWHICRQDLTFLSPRKGTQSSFLMRNIILFTSKDLISKIKQGQAIYVCVSASKGCTYHLGWRKEWICSERPITIYPIVKCWTHARSTRQAISARSRWNKDPSGLLHWLHYWKTLSAEHQFFGLLVAISWHWLRLACSGWPAGFESTWVWSSKLS